LALPKRALEISLTDFRDYGSHNPYIRLDCPGRIIARSLFCTRANENR